MSRSICPPPGELERLFLGGSPEPELEELEQHLLQCSSCLEASKRLSQAKDALPAVLRGPGMQERVPSSPAAAELMDRLRALLSSTARAEVSGASMVVFTCVSCRKKLSVSPSMAGKRVKCPGCGQVVQVPAAVPAGPPSAANRTLSLPPDSRPGSLAAESPTNKGDLTIDSQRPGTGHDSSLTDFLAPAQSDDELGRLGKYRVLQILGHGGMGVVYKAEDPLLKRAVALKAMLPTLAVSASAGKRFIREAQAMAAVEHDHVVRVHEVAVDRGVPYLAMEFLKGEPLDARLEREKKLPVAEVLRLGREIAEGLAAAHERGLIHRDIKPGNIWLEAPKGRVKILDFGLARSTEQESGLTQQGAIVGTPAYMAPEQASGVRVDARCDLFSLGVILYRLCCGQAAFQGTDTISTLVAVATHQPPPPILAEPELPLELSDLVMQLLEKDPARRIASARDVVQSLEAIEKKLAVPAQAAVASSDAPAASGKQKAARASGKPAAAKSAPRRRAPVFVAVALLLVGLIGAGLWATGLIRFSTDEGDLVLQTDDPDFAFAAAKGGGLTLEDRKAKRNYHVKAVRQGKGEYDLEVTDRDADLVFKTRTFAVKRGDTVALKAWFERKEAVTVQPTEKDAAAEDDAWVKKVAALPFHDRIAPLVARLKEDHPGWDGKVTEWSTPYGPVAELGLKDDLSPLRALTGGGLCLWLGDPTLKNLSSLKSIKLKHFMVMLPNGTGGPVTDLSPLKGMPLTGLALMGAPVSDLSPLQGMQLTELLMASSPVVDLSPLKGMPLKVLNLERTPVTDLSPLKGMPLEWLSVNESRVTDLSPLRDSPLSYLKCDFDPKRDGPVLRSIKSLELLNEQPARGVVVSARGDGARVVFPSLKTDAAGDLTIEAIISDPYEFGTDNFQFGLYYTSPCVRFKSKSFDDLLRGPARTTAVAPTFHMAVVKSPDRMRFFLDGKLVAQREFAEPLRLDAPESFMLRNGMAKGIRVSRVARYQGDYKPVERFAADADTLALYHCDDGEGEIVYDSSGNNHHGRMEGNARWARAALNPVVLKPVRDDWVKEVAAEPAEKQLARVLRRVQERNPGFDGKAFSKVADGAVTELWLNAPVIVDIDPVRALPKLQVLRCGPAVGDLSPLRGLPLKEVSCEFKPEHAAILRSIKTLEKINGKPAAEFWKDMGAAAAPVLEAWFADVAKLPAEKQVEAVAAKLEERNPGWDGTLKPTGEKGVVTGLQLEPSPQKDLSPLRALTGLESLDLKFGQLSDLSSLKGLKLRSFSASFVPVTDLSPLQGMRLERLTLRNTPVSDLSPLSRRTSLKRLDVRGSRVTDLKPVQGLLLESIACDVEPIRDAAVLKGMSTLQRINDVKAADFFTLPAMRLAQEQWLQDLAALPLEKWIEAVAALPAEKQLGALDVKLVQGTPHSFRHSVGSQTEVKDGRVVSLWLEAELGMDLAPVLALRDLQVLYIGHDASFGKITRLPPLKGTQIKILSCHGNFGLDDLSPLQGSAVTELSCRSTGVSDLSPLRGLKLTWLHCAGTAVKDLSPLQGMPLTRLECHKTQVTDLSPLKGMPLKELNCDFQPERDGAILRSIKTLEKINGKPAAEFWKDVEAAAAPIPEPWFADVAKLPPEKQVEAVVAKLKERNPGFDGKVAHEIKDGVVTRLQFVADHITDISPVRALARLESFDCYGRGPRSGKLADLSPLASLNLKTLGIASTKVSDLRPLKDMKLSSLNCGDTAVSDLSPLAGMPLKFLVCDGGPVKDLSPLRGLPLKLIMCQFRPERDAEILRAIKTLETINNEPAAGFWKEVDAAAGSR
jgi:Leucine-rich repeat (LRR) protein